VFDDFDIDSSPFPPVPARLKQVSHLHPLELLRHPLFGFKGAELERDAADPKFRLLSFQTRQQPSGVSAGDACPSVTEWCSPCDPTGTATTTAVESLFAPRA